MQRRAGGTGESKSRGLDASFWYHSLREHCAEPTSVAAAPQPAELEVFLGGVLRVLHVAEMVLLVTVLNSKLCDIFAIAAVPRSSSHICGG